MIALSCWMVSVKSRFSILQFGQAWNAIMLPDSCWITFSLLHKLHIVNPPLIKFVAYFKINAFTLAVYRLNNCFPMFWGVYYVRRPVVFVQHNDVIFAFLHCSSKTKIIIDSNRFQFHSNRPQCAIIELLVHKASGPCASVFFVVIDLFASLLIYGLITSCRL